QANPAEVQAPPSGGGEPAPTPVDSMPGPGEGALEEQPGRDQADTQNDLLDGSEFLVEGDDNDGPDSDEVTREFQVESLLGADLESFEQEPWAGTKYPLGSAEYNGLEPQRQAEAASYQKLVATF